jgi:hypothetical protein
LTKPVTSRSSHSVQGRAKAIARRRPALAKRSGPRSRTRWIRTMRSRAIPFRRGTICDHCGRMPPRRRSRESHGAGVRSDQDPHGAHRRLPRTVRSEESRHHPGCAANVRSDTAAAIPKVLVSPRTSTTTPS